jgi:hypothetical protein
MQNFSDLCRMYHDLVQRNQRYALRAANFLRGFAEELARQVDAPPTFTMTDENRQVPYVRALTLNAETGNFEPAGISLHWDDKNGAWDGGVGIHLEPAKNAFPKTEFAARVQFKLKEDNIDLEIPPNGRFQMTIGDRASWLPAIEHIIDRLSLSLNLQPWERYEELPTEERETIGFVRFDKE